MSDNVLQTGNPANQFIRSENAGIRNLQNVTRDLRQKLPGNLQHKTPIVLVPGFAGWGKPFLGAVNYFGGFSDLASALAAQGHIVICARLSPLSSNKERACELFQQISSVKVDAAGSKSGFDEPGEPSVPVDVNFGNLPLDPLIEKKKPQTWPAIVHGWKRLPKSWQWSKTNRLTFICHSQGGTTVRYLLHLLSGRAPSDLPQFPRNDEQARVKAVTTLGTPHKGTTLTDVAESFLQDDPNINLNVIVDLITSCSFADRKERIYDLGLDHWGFTRSGQETYQDMRQRITPAVIAWWHSKVNGIYDNSIAGATALNTLAASQPLPPPTYFFTMAFCATTQFPTRTLSREDIEGFFELFPAGGIASMFGIPRFASSFLNFANWARISPPLVSVLGWVTDVASRHLKAMGYFSQIPRPGEQIPRPDMLLVLAPFAYAMGGEVAGGRERRRNDGVVNTISMDGPEGRVKRAEGFVAELDAVNPRPVQGKFWYFGENGTIDHADQIGVFTDLVTNAEVEVMYKLFAELTARIP